MNISALRTLLFGFGTGLFVLEAAAYTPVLNLIEPRGGQRGTEVIVTLQGDRLFEPQELLLYQPGITVTKLEKEGESNNTVKAWLTIAPDAPLGEHIVRLRCKGGVSYQRTFWVGQFPTVMEARSEDNQRDLNDLFEEPQEIPLNTTVQGVADREDADYYRVQCKKGQRLSVEVEGMRLGRSVFDPYVAILNKERFELASSDDTALLFRDCAASIMVPEDGPFTIQVRESSYDGRGDCQYRLHVGEFPRPMAIYPPGARPGEEREFTFIGDPSGEIKASLSLPGEERIFPGLVKNGEWFTPSGLPIRLNSMPSFNEEEPNEGSAEATPAEAPDIPVAFHGILSKNEDKDWFKFRAKKGQQLRAQVFARQLRSPLDAYIIVRKEGDAKQIGNNDDAGDGDPDSRLDFEVPEDGVYNINIRDQLYGSGPDSTYRIEIAPRGPSLSATLPYAQQNNSQELKMISIPRGNRVGRVVNLGRSNIGCDLALEAPQLPSGVAIDRDLAPRSINTMPVIFGATEDAPIGGGLYALNLKDPESGLTGPFEETINHIEVNNVGSFHSYSDRRLAIAVIEEAPFHLDLEIPPVPLVRNGVMDLKITATRHGDFDENIRVTLPWRPPGIGAPSNVDIPKGQSEVTMGINANGDAPLAKWRIFVTGEAGTSRGPIQVSSTLQPVEITEPYVGGSIELAATEPGVNANLICKVEVQKEFNGDAAIVLSGLPYGVQTKELTINKDAKEVIFPLEVAADAKLGKTSNLFCTVAITENGHPIRATAMGGGVLRIDPPPPAPVTPVAKQEDAKPAEPQPPEEKRLSRLEQLRLESKNK